MSRLTLRQLKKARSGLRPLPTRPPGISPDDHDHLDVEHCQRCGRHYSWAWWHRKTCGHDPADGGGGIWAEELEEPFGEIEFAPLAGWPQPPQSITKSK